ncbi:hypothetical protein [Actinobaculum sp. 352]|uniref:hypothetical protein n=1 Tax=Actinobaculum sp. 352 TaxID=2490946 RepID=UPI000F7EFF29|nr:hypothetical protein [Actinobaculum sp. 352]RTE50377.1 hypothetical protein EKN07_04055 [Actinobaculum sp. 352]
MNYTAADALANRIAGILTHSLARLDYTNAEHVDAVIDTIPSLRSATLFTADELDLLDTDEVREKAIALAAEWAANPEAEAIHDEEFAAWREARKTQVDRDRDSLREQIAVEHGA